MSWLASRWINPMSTLSWLLISLFFCDSLVLNAGAIKPSGRDLAAWRALASHCAAETVADAKFQELVRTSSQQVLIRILADASSREDFGRALEIFEAQQRIGVFDPVQLIQLFERYSIDGELYASTSSWIRRHAKILGRLGPLAQAVLLVRHLVSHGVWESRHLGDLSLTEVRQILQPFQSARTADDPLYRAWIRGWEITTGALGGVLIPRADIYGLNHVMNELSAYEPPRAAVLAGACLARAKRIRGFSLRANILLYGWHRALRRAGIEYVWAREFLGWVKSSNGNLSGPFLEYLPLWANLELQSNADSMAAWRELFTRLAPTGGEVQAWGDLTHPHPQTNALLMDRVEHLVASYFPNPPHLRDRVHWNPNEIAGHLLQLLSLGWMDPQRAGRLAQMIVSRAHFNGLIEEIARPTSGYVGPIRPYRYADIGSYMSQPGLYSIWDRSRLLLVLDAALGAGIALRVRSGESVRSFVVRFVQSFPQEELSRVEHARVARILGSVERFQEE